MHPSTKTWLRYTLPKARTTRAIVHYKEVYRLDNRDVANCMFYMKALVTEGRSGEVHKLSAQYNKLTGSKFIRG